MRRDEWPGPVIEQDDVFDIGQRVRILASRNPKNKGDAITGKSGTVKSGLRKQSNPNSTPYVGYEVLVDGHSDSLNAAGHCLIPSYRLEASSDATSYIRQIVGRICCFLGRHEMHWGFGSPQPGHCIRGCGHREVDAS